jgi:hypothetical protein
MSPPSRQLSCLNQLLRYHCVLTTVLRDFIQEGPYLILKCLKISQRMKLLIEVLILVVPAKRLAESLSFGDICADHDSNVLLIDKIAIARKTTDFLTLVKVVVLAKILISVEELGDIVFIEKRRLRSVKCEHDDQSTRQHLQDL